MVLYKNSGIGVTLWQFDSLVDLPACVCEGSDKLTEHAQLLRLMQFLMGLDDVYGSVRSIILTSDPIPDVKSAFATLSRDESHRNSNMVSKTSKSRPTAFAARNTSNVGSTSNSNNRSFKKNVNNQNNSNNVSNGDDKSDHNKSASHTLINDQYQRLMVLLSGTGDTSKGFASVSGKNLIAKDVLVVPGYHVSLLSVHKLYPEIIKLSQLLMIPKCLIQDSTQRLGHPADQVLEVLKHKIKDVNQTNSGPCDICHKAKQTREPFPLSNHKLPTAVLAGKSPYELVYNSEPSLLHLRTFGCLCFSTVLNETDKFASKSEKCVFVGYAFDKKGYKLFSLDNKKFLFSRDVKFYETVFPFKNKSFTKDFVFEKNGINDLNFFNENNDSSPKSDEPYDDGGVSAGIGSKPVPETSTHNPSDSTIEAVASETVDQTDKSDTIDVTGSTSSRKVSRENEYATEADVSEGIQGTKLDNDEYESEGEDIESFGHLFGRTPENAQYDETGRKS
ncbi:ribonuclease H-like domain-containing protein [Tanacetum coccineum]